MEKNKTGEWDKKRETRVSTNCFSGLLGLFVMERRSGERKVEEKGDESPLLVFLLQAPILCKWEVESN